MALKNKKLGGRPEYSPTEKDRAFARAMTMAGVQQDRIAEVLEIAPKTLRKYFREEIDFGRDHACANVVANLYRQATKDDPRAIPAAIYWTKAQMGWKEANVHEHTGANGGPITFDGARSSLAAKLARVAKP
jgi:hypothetical protein